MTPPTQPKSLNKKHVARLERENTVRRYLVIGGAAIVVIVLGLVLFGIYQTTILPPTQSVAKVEQDNITSKAFQDRVRFERNRLVQQYINLYQTAQNYKADNPEMAAYFEQNMAQILPQLEPAAMGEQVLERMIREILTRQEAIKRGITVSEDEVTKRIQMDFGYNADGPTPTATAFPTMAPTSTLSVQQMTLVPQYTETPTLVPTETATPAVTATPTLLPSPTAVPSLTPTATPYTLELFEIDYKGTLDRLKEEINVSEQDLRELIRNDIYRTKLYDEMTADLPTAQEQVWARHILVADEATAAIVEEALKADPDWKVQAAKYSTDPGSKDNGGELGWFGKGMMVPEFEEAVFQLKIGEISQPVKTQFGYHIIQVLGHETRPISSYEYEQHRQKSFEDWVEKQRKEAKVEIFELWKERVPATPDVPEAYKAALLESQQMTQEAAQQPTQVTTPQP